MNDEKTLFRRRLTLAQPMLNAVAEATYLDGRRGMSDNEVAAKTFLQVGRSQHVTPRIARKTNLIEVVMEAEQLNALTNKIQDLRTRNIELRRYL